MLVILALAVGAVAHARLLYTRPRVRPAVSRTAHRVGTSASGGARRLTTNVIARLAVIGALIGLAWSATFWRLVVDPSVTVLGVNDYPAHLDAARQLSFVPLHLTAANFLFHALAKGGELIAGPRAGPVLALAALTATSYVGVVLLFLEPSRSRATVLSTRTAAVVGAAYFFMETPVLILIKLGAVSETTPFATVHWWPNATFLAALPFAFLALPLIEHLITDSEAGDETWRSTHRRYGLALVLILGTLAKPAFTLVLVPALPIYLLLRGVKRVTLTRMLTWAVAPTAAVILWQTWFLHTEQSWLVRTGQSDVFRSNWTFAPIVRPIYGWHRMGPLFWFPLLLVALAAWASRGGFFRERSVQLVLAALAIAVPLMLTIRETGDKSGEGNLSVPTQACVAVLLTLALRTITWESVELWRGRRRSPRPPLPVWSYVAVLVVGLLLLGGSLALLDGSGLVRVPANWELPYQGT